MPAPREEDSEESVLIGRGIFVMPIKRSLLPKKFRENPRVELGRGYHTEASGFREYALRIVHHEIGLNPSELKELVEKKEVRKLAEKHGVDIFYLPEIKSTVVRRHRITLKEAAREKYHIPVHEAFNAFVKLAHRQYVKK